MKCEQQLEDVDKSRDKLLLLVNRDIKKLESKLEELKTNY
jgi:hypothetical protein